MKKGPNAKLFLIMALATLFAGMGAVYFQYNLMSGEEAKVQDLKKQARDQKTVQADLEKSAKQLSDCSTELKHLEQGVPEGAYVPTMLTDLETTGRASGLVVTGVRPMPKPAAKKDEKNVRKPYDELDIEVKGSGNYGAIMSFVKALNSFPKIVAARMVTMVPKTDASRTGPSDLLDVQIQLKAFVFPTKDKAVDGGIKQDG